MERKKKNKPGSGGFQSFGLNKELLKSVLKTGYNVPTPIQKKAIPLLIQGRDVVAMARTGSGKTAAFLIPCIQRLGQHSPNVGARALILSPTRELAMQTVRFFKLLSQKTNLRLSLLAGGYSLEDQFAELTTNPDVLIATPGRLIHILDEANIKLKCMEYVVLDEADRLFEMGFARSILDILRRCPENRQMALFSATLPAAVAEFTGSSLHDPAVVRLDTEIRISDTLQLAFFNVRNEQKWPALLYILRDVLHFDQAPKDSLTVIFVQTRHHAEFLAMLLAANGYKLSIIHGNMDQEARKESIDEFRASRTQLLVVTDVAARGLDIPLLTNVINFSFPAQPKLFVHRAGRAGRQGRIGFAYSLVSLDEMPYLVDLHLFLGRPLRNTPEVNFGSLGGEETEVIIEDEPAPDPSDGYFGILPEYLFQNDTEFVQRVLEDKCELKNQFETSLRAQQAYIKTRQLSSPESVRRCKILLTKEIQPHPMLGLKPSDVKREKMVNELKTFRPPNTIFEAMGEQNVILPFGRKDPAKRRPSPLDIPLPKPKKAKTGILVDDLTNELEDEPLPRTGAERRQAHASQLWMGQATGEDTDFFIPYQKKVNFVEMGYSINKEITLDLAPDTAEEMAKNRQVYQWDKKKKKYVKSTFNDMKTRGISRRKNEAGKEADLSKKKNYYNKWMDKTKLRIPEAGEVEPKGAFQAGKNAQKRFHRGEKVEDAAGVKSELKNLDVIKKERKQKRKQKEKEAKGQERNKAKAKAHAKKGGKKAPRFPRNNSGTSGKKWIKFGGGGGSRGQSGKGGKGKGKGR